MALEDAAPAGRAPGDPADVSCAPYECAIVTTPAELASLENDWNALHAAAREAYVHESFSCTRINLDLDPIRRRGLWCVAVRKGDQLVAVWPLTVRRRVLWRVATPIASGGSEYCPFLIHPKADANGVWNAIHRELRDRRSVDAVHMLNVRNDGPLGRCLAQLPGSAAMDALPAPFLRRADFPGWESYQAGLPAGVRARLRRDRRRLEQLGPVRFVELSDPAERRSICAWMIAQKRRWLVRNGLRSDWMFSEAYARFLTATVNTLAPSGARRIFVLKAAGVVVAAELVSVDQVRVESFLGTYNDDFARCGPGNQLRDEIIRWAFERGLSYDCRIGPEPYKRHCASQIAQVASYAFGVTAGGKVFVAYEVARRWMARNLPESVRNRLSSFRHWTKVNHGRPTLLNDSGSVTDRPSGREITQL